MSASTPLLETPRDGLDPVNPKLAQQYEQMVDLLARRLTPAHARLFSEPVPITIAGTGRPGIAWFAAADGEAQVATQLELSAATTLKQAMAGLVDEITRFADLLEREGDASRDFARLLRDALTVPGDECLWSVDGKPVLVCWGYRRARAEGMSADRSAAITGTGLGSRSAAALQNPVRPVGLALPATPVVTVPVRRERRFGLAAILWLVAALLFIGLADRLLGACALGTDAWPAWSRLVLPNRCPPPSNVVDESAGSIRAAIRSAENDIHGAELDLTRRALSCEAPEVMPVMPRRAAAEPPRSIAADVEQRLQGIERGKGLELTLAWEGAADLDLSVVCPSGNRIEFSAPAACGGRLVADQNQGGGSAASRPVEHIIWDEAVMRDGRYAAKVNLYGRHGDNRPEIPFRVVLSRGGQVVREEAGRVSVVGAAQGVLMFDSPFPSVASAGSTP